MNNLSQECIEQIKQHFKHELVGETLQELFAVGAKEALTNPTIYQSAGLITVEEALRFVDSLRDYTSESHSILGHDDRTTTELLNIFRNQNQEK